MNRWGALGILIVTGTVAVAGCGQEGAGADDSPATAPSPVIQGNVVSGNTGRVVAIYRTNMSCSGTLLNSVGWVLTAAHCVVQDSNNIASAPVDPWILFGTTQNNGGVTRPSSAVPGAQIVRRTDVDVALVLFPLLGMQFPALVSGPRPVTDAFYAGPLSTLVNTFVNVLGFGYSDFNTGQGILRTALVQIDAASDAGGSYSFEPNMGQTVWQGDSGGPTFFVNLLRGSNVHPNRLLGIHRDVSAFGGTAFDSAVKPVLPWIADTLGGLHIYADGSGASGNLYLDVQSSGTANGTRVWLYGYNTSGAQHWWYDPATSTIRNQNGKCLDLPNNDSSSSNPIQIFDCNQSQAQQWTFTANNEIVHQASGRCLDIPGSNFASQQTLQLWDCNGTSAQQWYLTPSF